MMEKKQLIKDLEQYKGIMDSSNVAMLMLCPQAGEEFINIEKPKILMKKLCTIAELRSDMTKEHIYTPNNTKIQYKYFNMANEIIKLMLNGSFLFDDEKQNNLSFEVYEAWNEKTNTWIKDYPVLLTHQGYGFLIAPKLHQEET